MAGAVALSRLRIERSTTGEVSGMQAERYEIQVHEGSAGRARELLDGMPAVTARAAVS